MLSKQLHWALSVVLLIGLIFTPSLAGTASFFFKAADALAAQAPYKDGPSKKTPQFESVAPDAVSSSQTVGMGQVSGEIKSATGSAIYLVRLEDPALANYSGSVTGLEATTPAVTGARKLDVSSPAAVAYRQYLTARHIDLINRMDQDFKRSVEIVYQYYAANNGLAVRLTPQEAAAVANMPGVVFVQRDKEMELQTDAGPEWIGAPGIWNGTDTGGLPGTKGEGIVVGVIDTGINPSNPSFADVGGDGYDHTNPRGRYYGVCDSSDSSYDPTFPCNDKLIGAWGYPTVNGGDPRDYDGHGSHTASTSAGNVISATVIAPTITITRTISGVAPHANLIAYAACCTNSALSAAIDQIVIDAVDVVNYSIGSVGCTASPDPWSDFDSAGYLAARNAGIFVATSAGNCGPGADTVGSPADVPWVTSVGASTHNRVFANILESMSGGATTPPANISGKGFTSGYGPAPIVYAGDYGDALCLTPFPANTWTNGEIVVCDRGTAGRVEKAANVAAGGAGGYVLANDAASGNSLVGDAYPIPGVHITYADGQVLEAWLADGGANHMATIHGTFADLDPTNGDVMASFSSRGGNKALPDILVPSVTAPGVDILAALGTGDAIEWGFESGTSMASPHTAGAGALLMALHPTWTPAEIQSALMTTAWTTLLKEDGVTPANTFDIGSGRIDLSKAGMAGLVLDESNANYVNANPATGGDPKTLNLASAANSQCLQQCSWTRTLTSTMSSPVLWTASTSGENGLVVSVDPISFTLPAGGTQVITITADVTGLPTGAWVFGQVSLDPEMGAGTVAAHLPVAVKPSTGVIPTSLTVETRRNAGSQLISGIESIAVSDLTITPYGLSQAALTSQSLSQDATNSDPYDNFNDGTTFFITTTVPADAKRLVAQITYSEAPDVDLFVGRDVDSDNTPQLSEQVCASTSSTAAEYCDVTDPLSGVWWILVQNWNESASAPDLVTLASAVVPGSDSGNMTVTGPSSVPLLTPYDLRFYWDTPGMVAGDYWFGAFSVGSDPAHPDNIGTIPVDIHRHEDDVSKTANTSVAMPGDVVTFTVSVQPNVTPVDLTYTITDTLPAGFTYVLSSASVSAGSVAESSDTITWTVGMPVPAYEYLVSNSDNDPMCDTGFGGYVNLQGYGIFPQASISGDTKAWTAFSSGNPINFYGIDNTGVFFTDDGFAGFDVATNWVPAPEPWTNQSLPDATIPNNLMAMFWKDMQIVYTAPPVNTGVTLATAGPNVYVIEYDNAQVFNKPGQNYDFEVVGTRAVDDAAGAYEIVYAYDNINGPINDATIGVENPDGTQATQYAYNNATPTTLHNGLMICFDYKQVGAAPATLTFQATVDANAVNQTLTNTALHNTDNPGSKEAGASASVLVPGNGVDLSPVSDAKSAHPTDIVTYTLDLTNTGSVTDTVVLSYTGSTWNVSLPVTTTQLSAGESTTIEVSVEIPDHTPDGDSDTVTITATSQGDPSKSASSDLTTTSVWYRLLMPWIGKAP